nr:uncharacterized protein LOC113823637 [Penaeus vannamei]
MGFLFVSRKGHWSSCIADDSQRICLTPSFLCCVTHGRRASVLPQTPRRSLSYIVVIALGAARCCWFPSAPPSAASRLGLRRTRWGEPGLRSGRLRPARSARTSTFACLPGAERWCFLQYPSSPGKLSSINLMAVDKGVSESDKYRSITKVTCHRCLCSDVNTRMPLSSIHNSHMMVKTNCGP